MNRFEKKCLTLFLSLFIMISIQNNLVYAENTFAQVVEGFDWGPCVTKMIIHLDSQITVGSEEGILDNTAFSVLTTMKGYVMNDDEQPIEVNIEQVRTVEKAYTSDEKGNYIKETTNYITLELLCNPKIGNPFTYNLKTLVNEWSDPYTSVITLTKDVTSGTTTLTSSSFSVNQQPTKNFNILIDDVFTINKTHTANDKTLTYGYYQCTNTTNKGLLIWIHGMGEGGTDNKIVLYGNRVTALADTKIQTDLKNNCDILVVQTPTFWLDLDKKGKEIYSPEIYTETFKSLVDKYVSENNIAEDRIYIGGCSMGGFMTMNMILNYPTYFAAAYFAAEAYADQYISDEQIQSIKNIPMWFIHSENDETVNISLHTNATYKRLQDAGATDLHYSHYDKVVDTSRKYDVDGAQYEYDGHWSWVYLFNDECKDGDETVFTWIVKQTNPNIKDDSSTSNASKSDVSDDSSSYSFWFNKISILVSLFIFIFIF
jgi:predicted peptidase